MNTKIFSASAEDLKEAAELIKSGKRVIFPTETVYGLGVNALDPKAVKSVFEAKGRPSDNPLIVHISTQEQLKDIAKEPSDKAKLLMEKFWPGPLTVILERQPNVPDEVTAGLGTVGVRMPENETARELISLSGVPVAAPSANISGRPSPTDAEYVIEDMMGRVEGIIDGGNCSVGVESTVIDMTGEVPTILRPGGITAEEIASLLGEVRGGSQKTSDNEAPKAPGMKYTHYAPKAPVRILSGTLGEIENFINSRGCRCGILTFDEIKPKVKGEIISLGSINDPKECARRLFRSLRDMDKRGVEEIYAPEIGTKGLWAAIRNRLYKSAGGKIISAKDREILFVCTGNTCRSPMAEGIFNSFEKTGFFASSAGVFASVGQYPSENAVLAAKELGADIKNHRARQLDGEMLERAYMAVTMTSAQKNGILSAYPFISEKVMTISEVAGGGEEVSDPYGGDFQTYLSCAKEIKALLEKFRERLCGK